MDEYKNYVKFRIQLQIRSSMSHTISRLKHVESIGTIYEYTRYRQYHVLEPLGLRMMLNKTQRDSWERVKTINKYYYAKQFL